jgi:hypothetical protein
MGRGPAGLELLSVLVAYLFGVGPALLVFAEHLIIRLPQGGLAAAVAEVERIGVDRGNAVSVGFLHGRAPLKWHGEVPRNPLKNSMWTI